MASRLMEKLKKTVSPNSKGEDQQADDSTPRERETSAGSGKSSPRRRSDPAKRPDPRIRINQHGQTACESHDVRDAAHVPPSVLAKHLGEPTIEHDYPEDSMTKRHSMSHQERHYLHNAEA